MNYAIVLRLLSYILYCEAALLLLPAMASLIYGEWMVLGVFLLTAALSAAAGALLHRIKPKSQIFYMREGFATTALCWLLISVVGAVPFVLTGSIPNPVDAMFETVSGFTTTGASILPAVEDLPRGILFWRSFTHWIGGMGVLVFLLSLLPLTGGSHVNLMKAESPGPQVDKLVPKVQSTAKILYGIYFGLTVIEFVFLLFGGMPVFESLLTSFGTAGTGGFGFRNDSFASMSPYVQWVVTIFMILFGVNFNAYFLLLMRRFRRAAASEEVRAYFVIIGVAVVIITANIYSMYNGLGEALRHAGKYRGESAMSTYLCGIAKNLLRREWARQARRRHVPLEEDEDLPAPESAEGSALENLRRQALFHRIHALPERMREVVYLRLAGDLPFAEIGAILGESETWARVTFYRAKLQIAAYMEATEHEQDGL